MARQAVETGDDGTNDLIVSDGHSESRDNSRALVAAIAGVGTLISLVTLVEALLRD